MKNFRKIFAVFVVLLLYCNCYKARNDNKDTSIPSFTIYVGSTGLSYYNSTGGGTIKDSIVQMTTTDSTQLQLRFTFTLISGDPENYPLTCYLSNLPIGVTTISDSFVFKLNYDFEIDLNVNADTGNYLINLHVNTANSANIYPLRLHVLPTPPAQDCAPGIVAVYNYSGYHKDLTSGISIYDSCTVTVDTIIGTPHYVHLTNFPVIGSSIVSGYVDCNGYLTIPVQTINGYIIYGLAGCNTDINNKSAIDIRDTIINAGDTVVCSAFLRQ